MKKFRIAIDFDGVLHQYDGWRDGSIYGDPVPGAVETLQRWSKKYDLVIFTCREPLGKVHWWIKDNFGLNITCVVEKPHADLYIDDRGLRFEGDWAKTSLFVESLDRRDFKTYSGYSSPVDHAFYSGVEGTRTGRLSCSNPNLSNLPQELTDGS